MCIGGRGEKEQVYGCRIITCAYYSLMERYQSNFLLRKHQYDIAKSLSKNRAAVAARTMIRIDTMYFAMEHSGGATISLVVAHYKAGKYTYLLERLPTNLCHKK